MQKFVIHIVKAIKRTKLYALKPIDWIITSFIFYSNGVKYRRFKSYGYPIMNIGLGGRCSIGTGFVMNNREMANPIGRFNRCSIMVSKNAELVIGRDVGMSSTAIVCHRQINIGNNVKFGGNVVVYDTDFHSLIASERAVFAVDMANANRLPVTISDNVFIGAHSTILKGVEIGENAIIGAGSVVTKNIPANEIWGGNPAKKIRSLSVQFNGIS